MFYMYLHLKMYRLFKCFLCVFALVYVMLITFVKCAVWVQTFVIMIVYFTKWTRAEIKAWIPFHFVLLRWFSTEIGIDIISTNSWLLLSPIKSWLLLSPRSLQDALVVRQPVSWSLLVVIYGVPFVSKVNKTYYVKW